MWLLRLLLRLCHVDRKHATPERASFIRGPCPAGGLTPLAPSHVSLSCYAGDRGRRDLHRWGSQLFIPYSPRKRSLSSHSPCFLLDTALMYCHDKMQNAPRHRVLGPPAGVQRTGKVTRLWTFLQNCVQGHCLVGRVGSGVRKGRTVCAGSVHFRHPSVCWPL